MEQIQPLVELVAGHPFVVTVVLGIVYPLIQAALDKPWWTSRRRAILVSVVAVLVAIAVTVVSTVKLDVQAITAAATSFLGVAWAVYQILSKIKIADGSILDWVGVKTPGGATSIAPSEFPDSEAVEARVYEPKH